MKNYFKIMIALVLLAATGCQTSDDAQVMLQDESERREVYNTILDNEEMRNEMVAMMRERNMSGMAGHGGMMRGGGMMGDTMGMGAMMGDTTGMRGMNRQQMQAHMQQMMAVCGKDTAACTMMTDMMLQNRDLMGNMMRQIRQRGRMEPGCMQQLMREIGL